MKQQRIKELLIEAADPKCTPTRCNEILCEFGEASAATGEDGKRETETPGEGIHTLLSAVFVDALESRREVIPSFFPFFAAACGDREEFSLLADVNWLLL
jgi:hypothetical protein